MSFSPLTLALNHQCVGSLARLSGWRSDRILWIISSGNLVNPKGLQTFFSCTCVLGEFLPLFIFYINKTYFSYPVSEHILICIILKTNSIFFFKVALKIPSWNNSILFFPVWDVAAPCSVLQVLMLVGTLWPHCFPLQGQGMWSCLVDILQQSSWNVYLNKVIFLQLIANSSLSKQQLELFFLIVQKLW